MHELVEPLPFLAQPVRDRYAHAGEGQFAGVLSVQADLLEVAPPPGEAGGAGLDDEQGQSLVRIVGRAGRDDKQVPPVLPLEMNVLAPPSTT